MTKKTYKPKESPLFWPSNLKGSTLFVLDETLIPQKLHYITVKNTREAVNVIRQMKTRAFGQFLVVINMFLLEINNIGNGSASPDLSSGRQGEHDRSLQDIRKADVIVDAIFGVGLNREVLNPFRNVIAIINKEGKKVISVDTPSGLDGTSGKIYGVCVKADVTITFTFFKKGFFKGQGPKHTGQVIVVDIGIPRKLLMVNGKW